jgi:hypothetical protein
MWDAQAFASTSPIREEAANATTVSRIIEHPQPIAPALMME